MAAATLFTACSRQQPEMVGEPPEICGEIAMHHATAVYHLGPRFSGSPGALANIEYLQREITALGLDPVVDEWQEQTRVGPITFRNLWADIPGRRPDSFIIVGTHYDTKRLATIPDFAGANDGASGVGALLAMMHAIVNHDEPPRHSLRFIFFDGEECLHEYSDHDGLHGSRRHAAQIQEQGRLAACRAVVILDMIGDRDLAFNLPAGADPQLLQRFRELATHSGHAHRLKPPVSDFIDDHTPFQRLEVPTLLLIDFEYGLGNNFWHSPGDTLDKISADSMATAANLALALIWNPDTQ